MNEIRGACPTTMARSAFILYLKFFSIDFVFIRIRTMSLGIQTQRMLQPQENLGGKKIQSQPSLGDCLAVSPSLTSLWRSSAAARRDQNRIAQREFRLRKQQRVSIMTCHVTHVPDLLPVHYRFVTLKQGWRYSLVARMRHSLNYETLYEVQIAFSLDGW